MSELQYALDRMSTPLHASRISDATAAEDARCMAIIRAEIDRLTRELDEARAERDALANVLPGHYYMDPPDGGDVPVLEQLRRMAKDTQRYRLVRRGQHWSVINGIGDHLRADELDAAIDAKIEQERSEQAKEES